MMEILDRLIKHSIIAESVSQSEQCSLDDENLVLIMCYLRQEK